MHGIAGLGEGQISTSSHSIHYPVCPYSLRLTDYFVRASEQLLLPDRSIDEPTDIQHVELHHLFFIASIERWAS